MSIFNFLGKSRISEFHPKSFITLGTDQNISLQAFGNDTFRKSYINRTCNVPVCSNQIPHIYGFWKPLLQIIIRVFRTLPILCLIHIVRMLFDKLSLQVKCHGAFCSFAHLVVFLGTMAGFKCWESPTSVQIKFRNLVPPKLLDQWSWSLLKTGSLCSIDWLMCQQKSLKILVELHESVTERLCLRMSHKKTCSIFLAGRVRRNY